jgi:hypothetical protein
MDVERTAVSAKSPRIGAGPHNRMNRVPATQQGPNSAAADKARRTGDQNRLETESVDHAALRPAVRNDS